MSQPLVNPHRQNRRHREMLWICAAVVVLSFALQVVPDERVAFRGFADYPLPHTCVTKACFGQPCPGCGLTRSFIHLARADWQASLETHRFGWIMAFAILIQFPYRFLLLKGWNHPLVTKRISTIFGWFLISMLIGNWIWNVVDLIRA